MCALGVWAIEAGQLEAGQLEGLVGSSSGPAVPYRTATAGLRTCKPSRYRRSRSLPPGHCTLVAGLGERSSRCPAGRVLPILPHSPCASLAWLTWWVAASGGGAAMGGEVCKAEWAGLVEDPRLIAWRTPRAAVIPPSWRHPTSTCMFTTGGRNNTGATYNGETEQAGTLACHGEHKQVHTRAADAAADDAPPPLQPFGYARMQRRAALTSTLETQVAEACWRG